MPKFPLTTLDHTIKKAVDEHSLLLVLHTLIELCYHMRDAHVMVDQLTTRAWEDAASWLTVIEEGLERTRVSGTKL